MKKKLIIGGVIAILIGGFFFFRGKTTQTTQKQTTVYKGTLQEKITISGNVNASEKTTLRFQTTGKLASIDVKEGDIVKKSQRIASLDQRQLQKDLQKLLNTYMDSRWDLDQTKSDNQTTADSGASAVIRERAKRIIEQSQFTLNNTVLSVEAQTLSIEFANLYTPISGIITRVASPLPGIHISAPTQAEFDVVDPTSIYFEAVADQTEVTKLREGLSAQINLDAYPDTTVSGSIRMISFTPKIDEVGTVYPIHLNLPLDNSEYKYRLGMTGDVSFVINETNNVLILPSTFIESENGKQYVTVSENGNMIRREITTGMETDTETEIVSGLSEGDIVYD